MGHVDQEDRPSNGEKVVMGGREALFVIASVLFIIGTSLMVFEAQPHVPLFLSISFLAIYNALKRQSWSVVERGIIKGIQSGIVPIMIFMLIGILIAVWMKAGTLPTLIAYSFNMISPALFLPSVFLVTAIIGISIGSSFTTVSTVGIAFMGMGTALDVNLAMVAGSVVSGALLGDKMSPMSDTTNLASSVCKVDLFEHIRHMLWTMVPAAVITMVLFFIIGSGQETAPTTEVESWMAALREATHVHVLALIPAVVVIILAAKRVPAIPTMLTGIGVGFLTAVAFEGQLAVNEWMPLIQNGFEISSGNEQVDALVNGGGIQSMMWAVSLLILALSMGGILSTLGVIEALMNKLRTWMTTSGRAVATPVLTAMGLNISLGEQYMSVVLTGEAFSDRYREMGLQGKDLSRALESGGTVINALIPYGVAGVFMSSVLEVSVLEFLPYAFFCLLCPLITMFYGFTGIGMAKKT
ncbi:Na+/H+ antiporter NhaC [Texcoconibacillus texcoconensis]|uniref:NhaC family Na+:H+ antiporter n=1 Tax=Texcoconibacillus texcoconensis TaxID=1095777 RepID=A0A840QM99_9BACI|nr:Na+/H+ antiporter NhaC [Texcoconibacillus texcoconensis]MBB5172499.1 NhaC family Na+:H+ antiporter [Texcoconibacillus texcoconensis]